MEDAHGQAAATRQLQQPYASSRETREQGKESVNAKSADAGAFQFRTGITRKTRRPKADASRRLGTEGVATSQAFVVVQDIDIHSFTDRHPADQSRQCSAGNGPQQSARRPQGSADQCTPLRTAQRGCGAQGHAGCSAQCSTYFFSKVTLDDPLGPALRAFGHG